MFSEIKTVLLDFLFPIYCVECKIEKTHCCESCLSKIPRIQQVTEKTGDRVIAVAEFREKSTLAELIHRFKYDGAEDVGKTLASLFSKNLLENFSSKRILVPVPLHPRRYRFRGFNQSEILARELSQHFGLEVQELLMRNRYTRPQVELDGHERLSNLRGAFALKNPGEHLDPDTTFFIVDDVCTTGSTLKECADVLKKHGAQNTMGLVIARAV